MKKHFYFYKILQTIVIFISVGFLLAGCAITGSNKSAKAQLLPKIDRPMVSSNVKTIALLLPLTGNWAASSKAIHDGFLAAYYSDRQNQNGKGANVKVVNTAGKNIVDVYRETVAKGDVDVIVGPLTKTEVKALMGMGMTSDSNADIAGGNVDLINAKGAALPVPTIALNTVDDYQKQPIINLYQFGLSPQDEARQAATKILQSGYRNVAVIIPDNNWGRSISEIFNDELVRQNGQITAVLAYTPKDELDLKIRQFLQINDDELRQKEAVLHYRDDINAAFIIAEPKIARQIVPLIKFYTRGNLPLYATSAIYGGFVRSDVDQDLDDVTFSDMPWVIVNPADLDASLKEIRVKISTLWPDSLKGNSRLYALGIDAYKLAINLNKLLDAPRTGLAGATGELMLDDYNHIYRELRWTVMKHGIPQGL